MLLQEEIHHIQISISGKKIISILSFHCKLIITRSNDIWDGKVMKHFINEYKVLSK